MLTLFTILLCIAFVGTMLTEDNTEKRLMTLLTALFTLAAVGVWLVQGGVL